VPSRILEKAIAVIEERAETHGDYQENFQHISEVWSAYLQYDIAPAQVGIMMALLKFARDQCSPEHEPEHLLDAVGYAALAGAMAKKQKGGT
jgi:hypothetical protein